MKACVTTGAKRKLEYKEVPMPLLEPGLVLVMMRCALICGSDLEYLDRPAIPPGEGRGHEFVAEVTALDEVAAATAVIKSYGLSNLGGGQMYGVRLDEFCAVTGFSETLSFLKEKKSPGFIVPPRDSESVVELTDEQRQRGCIVGLYLLAQSRTELDRLRVSSLRPEAHLGLNVTVFGVNSQGALAGSGLGETGQFWYVDDSESGLVDIDMSAIYMDFDELQRLCGMDGVDGKPARAHEIRIKLAKGTEPAVGLAAIERLWSGFKARKAGEDSGKLLADVKVKGWANFRRSFIAPVEKEKNMMTLVFGLLSLVAVFIIFAIFYMIVTEKIKDLGIVRSVGASRWGLGQIFLGFGLLIGLIGALLGGVFGSGIVVYSNEIAAGLGISIWDPQLYAIDRIPDRVFVGLTVWIGLFAVAAALLGAVVPARRAGKLEVVEALRVE